MSDRTARFVGLYAAVAGVLAIFVSPLLAMSYFGIEDGKENLDTSTVSAWADPGRDLAGSLLTFASANRVYATYIQLFMLLVPSLFLCAWTVRSPRLSDMRRLERSGWRIALVGYALLLVGGVTVSLMLIKASPNGNFVNVPFLSLIVPGDPAQHDRVRRAGDRADPHRLSPATDVVAPRVGLSALDRRQLRSRAQQHRSHADARRVGRDRMEALEIRAGG